MARVPCRIPPPVRSGPGGQAHHCFGEADPRPLPLPASHRSDQMPGVGCWASARTYSHVLHARRLWDRMRQQRCCPVCASCVSNVPPWPSAVATKFAACSCRAATQISQISKFLIAGEPAEYRGSGRHPGVSTDRPKAFTVDEAVADRFGDLVTVRGWSAVLGLVFVLHGSRLTAMGPDASTALLPRLRLLREQCAAMAPRPWRRSLQHVVAEQQLKFPRFRNS
jgi:hypothetical protein